MKAIKRTQNYEITQPSSVVVFLKSKSALFYVFFMFACGVFLANVLNSSVNDNSPSVSGIYPPATPPAPVVNIADSAVATEEDTQQKDADKIAQKPSTPEVQAYDIDMLVARGDTFSGLLAKNGAHKDDIRKVTTEINKVFNLRHLKVGQKISMSLLDSNNTLSLRNLRINWPEKYIYATRLNNNKFNATEIKKELSGKFVRAEGVVRSSLLGLAATLDIPANVMADVVDAYSFDIDFQREIQPGSMFKVLYKIHTDKSGKQIGRSELHYASLSLNKRDINIFRYETSDGNVDYFKEDGRSVRKSLLRTPVSGGIISSHFGKRKHPILGYTRLHKGVDFAAARGTPILAAGDGSIDFIGRKGGYGKYIRIRHNNKYSSAYAHMSRFAKSMKKNKRIKQGQVIGYVGSTGASTGPHLHYEILFRNKHANPLTVSIPPGNKLKGKEFARFKKAKEHTSRLFSTAPPKTKLAKR